MAIKIAFIGTHGTGKTTLAHELVSKLKKQNIDAGYLGETVRRCPFPINKDATKKSQIWIILNQIISELETEGRCDVLVCDRSVFDNYAYYVNKFGRSNILEPLVKEHVKTYRCLIKVPIRPGFLKKDKIRSTDKKWQEEIDTEMNKLLKNLKINYIDYENSKSKIIGVIKNALRETHSI